MTAVASLITAVLVALMLLGGGSPAQAQTTQPAAGVPTNTAWAAATWCASAYSRTPS